MAVGAHATTDGRRRFGWIVDLISLLLFGLGAGLCVIFITRMLDWTAWGASVAALVVVRFLAQRPMHRGRWAAAAVYGTARLAILLFTLFAVYLAIAWTVPLWWVTSWWTRLAVALLLIGWLAIPWLSTAAPRIPLVLPLGVWVAACLVGWVREESFVRCDDYLRLRPPVTLLLPTTPELEACRPGERIPIGRYPRKFWQSPDGRWLRFTTQSGLEYGHPPGRLAGLVCELDLDEPGAPPRCAGGSRGKSHGIVGSDSIGKVFVVAWSVPGDGDRQTGVIFTLPEEGPLRIEAEHRLDDSVGDLVFEPSNRTLYAFCDTNDRIITLRWPSFQRLPDITAPVFPGQVHYDERRGEGVVCGWLTGLAIRGNPLAYRFFGEQAPSLWARAAMSWGCDWDPATRRVYTAVPNLGLLYEIDYDTGEIADWHWTGFGMRSATLDRRRGLLYLTDFLGGHVLAIDIATGEERHRWFVGRFVRDAYLSRDGDALFVSSNLGVLRIPLEPS